MRRPPSRVSDMALNGQWPGAAAADGPCASGRGEYRACGVRCGVEVAGTGVCADGYLGTRARIASGTRDRTACEGTEVQFCDKGEQEVKRSYES